MKLEKNEESLLFSTTSFSDLFFSEYLSEASGDSVKVYLYITFLSKFNKEIKLTDLSKKLDLPLKIIQDSLKYWENLGLLLRKNQGYEIKNIQEIELHKMYNPKVTISSKDLEEKTENIARASIIDSINNQFFNGLMSPSWYSDIELFYQKYKFEDGVMIALFSYCYNKSALHKNYIIKVAEDWHKNNVQTYAELEEYYMRQEQLQLLISSIKKKLRLTRNLTIFEEAFVEKWYNTYKFSMEIIDIALKRTTKGFNLNFDYIDKCLTDWYEKKLLTTEQINSYIQIEKTKPIQNKEKNSSSPEKRKYTNFDDFYSN